MKQNRIAIAFCCLIVFVIVLTFAATYNAKEVAPEENVIRNIL